MARKSVERHLSEMDYAVVRREPDGRVLVQQNSRPGSVNGQITAYPTQVLDQTYPGQQLAPSDDSPEKDQIGLSHRAHQNMMAIVKYNNEDKSKIREGRHAAAVAQMHQNDLHNYDKVREMPPSKEDGKATNGMLLTKEQLDRPLHSLGTRSQIGVDQDSELTTSFDPVKDRHTWAMWRTAVNGRIVDEVRRLERLKREKGTGSVDSIASGMYGTALVMPPLRQFVKFEDDESKAMADELWNLGQGSLHSSQFVYYGLPRVRLAQAKK